MLNSVMLKKNRSSVVSGTINLSRKSPAPKIGAAISSIRPTPRGSTPAIVEPEVKPELLMPYCDSWYLIGTCKQRNRLMMFDLDSVDGVNEGF